MCLAIPGKIKKIEGKKVLLYYPDKAERNPVSGEERYAFLGDEKVKIGDYVMVQMGIVIKVLTKAEAQAALEAWNKN